MGGGEEVTQGHFACCWSLLLQIMLQTSKSCCFRQHYVRPECDRQTHIRHTPDDNARRSTPAAVHTLNQSDKHIRERHEQNTRAHTRTC